MNKMLITVFDSEEAANVGLHALRQLHTTGDLTLYASGLMIKDAHGAIKVNTPVEDAPSGAATGLAVGSMIGLLGGPVGPTAGDVTSSVAGAVRDFWVAGVGLDFIDETERFLQPGKVALVAEIEEDWVNPVDSALEDAGGRVFRRRRSEVAQAWLGQDITAFESEIHALEVEIARVTDEARERLQTKLTASRIRLSDAVHRARKWADTLKQEADVKAALLTAQVEQAEHEAKERIEARAKLVNERFHARGAKLSEAWGLMKEAMMV